MLSLVPAVVGLPGGIELLVIFFVVFLLFGVPVTLALFLGYRYVKGQADEDAQEQRIEELESELAELRNRIDATTSLPDADGSMDETDEEARQGVSGVPGDDE